MEVREKSKLIHEDNKYSLCSSILSGKGLNSNAFGKKKPTRFFKNNFKLVHINGTQKNLLLRKKFKNPFLMFRNLAYTYDP